VNAELRVIKKENVKAYCKVLYRHLPAGTEKPCGNPLQDNHPANRDLKPEPPEHRCKRYRCVQGRIKLFGAPRQWKHFRPLFQAVFLWGGFPPPRL